MSLFCRDTLDTGHPSYLKHTLKIVDEIISESYKHPEKYDKEYISELQEELFKIEAYQYSHLQLYLKSREPDVYPHTRDFEEHDAAREKLIDVLLTVKEDLTKDAIIDALKRMRYEREHLLALRAENMMKHNEKFPKNNDQKGT